MSPFKNRVYLAMTWNSFSWGKDLKVFLRRLNFVMNEIYLRTHSNQMWFNAGQFRFIAVEIVGFFLERKNRRFSQLLLLYLLSKKNVREANVFWPQGRYRAKYFISNCTLIDTHFQCHFSFPLFLNRREFLKPESEIYFWPVGEARTSDSCWWPVILFYFYNYFICIICSHWF